MERHIYDYNELMAKAGRYLVSKLSYSQKTVRSYRDKWKQIRNFMASNGIRCYDRNVEAEILRRKFKDRQVRELNTREKHFYNAVKMLTQFQLTGIIDLPARICKDKIVFSGPIGDIITAFIYYRRIEKRMSRSSIGYYERNLSLFLNYCNTKGITSIKEINLAVLLQFINELDCNKPLIVILISSLRAFMKYTFEQQLTDVDYSVKIPKYKSVTQPKIPSTYTKKEIEKLISSIDRSSPVGKRNYVIILIAARLGLRASDISKLKFENLHWNTSTIVIKQFKTGKELALPLLPDVGNAIIDYLKYGRPKSEEPYVLLTERPPCGGFATSNVVTHVVQRAFIKACINIKGRRFGPHSLRHSLGFRMLEQSTVLPVISEVLGHENTESTKYYLRIDLASMKQCMLDVPHVSKDFYEQRGGAFYEYEL